MKARNRSRLPSPSLRPGFTLVELLVVTTIIAVLVSLVAGSIVGVINGQKVSNTEQTIIRLNGALRQQWDEVVKQAKSELPPPAVLTLAGGDPRRAQVIWVKLRLRQEFPQNFKEARQPHLDNTGKSNPYVSATTLGGKYLTLPILDNFATPPTEIESSVCLLMALSRQRGGARLNVDDMGSSAVAVSKWVDTQGQPLRQFVDAWSQPIRFTRWRVTQTSTKVPSSFLILEVPPLAIYQELDSNNPAQSGPNTKFRDPLDPEGLLLQTAWYNQPSPLTGKPLGQDFELLVHPISLTNQPQPPYYMAPIIWSIGPDGKPNINESSPTFGDEIYSFRLRTGARGD